jgi:hypothetical protein
MKTTIHGFLGLLVWAWPAVIQAQFDTVTNPDNTITITGYTGSGGMVVTPTNINGLPVTAILSNAFYLATNVTGVVVSDGVTNIGESAFEGCVHIASAALPDTLGSIGVGIFEECFSLTNVVIPNSITNIGNSAFYLCSALPAVTIPSSVTSLGVATFDGCMSLSRIVVPDGVLSIPREAFDGCSSLTNVMISWTVTNLGVDAFYDCPSLTSVVFQGDAPTADSSTFLSDGMATAYYLPGTTGWSNFSSTTSLPVVLWNPQIQTMDGFFGVGKEGFGFNVTGTPGIPIVVQGGASLTGGNWTDLQSGTLTNGSVYFADPAGTSYPNRFYRVTFP